tara:strand:- start:449 stop:700 length:252 start_codon:yes stop_codon:yes gene_type:complete
MTEYDNTNSGVLFKNDKEGNESRPDYTGKVDVEGTEYRVAAWVKTGSNSGKKFFSLKLSIPEAKPADTGNSSLEDDLGDSVPF